MRYGRKLRGGSHSWSGRTAIVSLPLNGREETHSPPWRSLHRVAHAEHGAPGLPTPASSL